MFAFALSWDGRRVGAQAPPFLFVSDRSNGSQIYSMNAYGSGVTQLTKSGTNRSPSW